MVLPKRNKFYTKRLSFTEDYKSYRRKQNAFKLTFIIPIAASLIAGIDYYSDYNNLNKYSNESHDRAIDLKSKYDQGDSQKSAAYYSEKSNYEALIKEQEKIKKQGTIVTSACMATALTFYIIDFVRKRKQFNETPLLTKINASYNPLYNQICFIVKL